MPSNFAIRWILDRERKRWGQVQVQIIVDCMTCTCEEKMYVERKKTISYFPSLEFGMNVGVCSINENNQPK